MLPLGWPPPTPVNVLPLWSETVSYLVVFEPVVTPPWLTNGVGWAAGAASFDCWATGPMKPAGLASEASAFLSTLSALASAELPLPGLSASAELADDVVLSAGPPLAAAAALLPWSDAVLRAAASPSAKAIPPSRPLMGRAIQTAASVIATGARRVLP